MEISYKQLKKIYHQNQTQLSTALCLRIERALSWLSRAEKENKDDDARFIFLWIAFNAAYSHELPANFHFSETKLFLNFLDRLLHYDQEKKIYHIIWREYSDLIRLLLDEPSLFQPYWEYRRGQISELEWQSKFKYSKAMTHRALGQMNTQKVLAVIFERLYVLRNQIFHGNSPWNYEGNRLTLRNSTRILAKLVPVIIRILCHSSSSIWGKPPYIY